MCKNPFRELGMWSLDYLVYVGKLDHGRVLPVEKGLGVSKVEAQGGTRWILRVSRSRCSACAHRAE